MSKVIDSQDLKELGNNIREKRIQRGWSQTKLANRANLSRNAVSSAEGAQSTISVDNLFQLADALGTTLDELAPSRFQHKEDNYVKTQLAQKFRLLPNETQMQLIDSLSAMIDGYLARQ